MANHSSNPFYSLTELATSFKKKSLKPSVITEFYINKIAEDDTKIGAFQTVFTETARLSAESADAAILSGNRLGPFHGIPFVLKDICELKGSVTTGGSKAFKERVSKVTATIANRLLAAGGVLLGKSKTVEFAFGGWGTNQEMGTPWNPWDKNNHRVCGGSSAGSAAALAGNLAVCAIGTDTGGSVRLPAAFCGLTGLKVTKNILSTKGIIPLSHTLDTPGPMARSVMDLVVMFEVLKGTDGWKIDKKISTETGIFRNLKQGVGGLHLGSIDDKSRNQCSSEVLRNYDALLLSLEQKGALIEQFIPPIDYWGLSEDVSHIIAVEAFYHHGYLYQDKTNLMDDDVRRRVMKAKDFSANQYLKILNDRKRLKKTFLRSMLRFDALLTPTITNVAPLLSDVDQEKSPGYFTRPFNYMGMCALSLPSGLNESGLPLSLQIAGRPNDEQMVLRVGSEIERCVPSIFKN